METKKLNYIFSYIDEHIYERIGLKELSVDKIRAWIDEQKKEDFVPEISIEQSVELDSGRFSELPV